MRARYPDCDGTVVRGGWALEIDGETLAATHLGLKCCDAAATRRLAEQLTCPVLVIHGTQDAVRALRFATEHPERAAGVLAIAPAAAVAPPPPRTVEPGRRWADPLDTPAGWNMRDRHFWRQAGGYRS